MMKRVILSIIVGVILFAFGVWMFDSSGPFSYWGYSQGTRTLMEWGPWLFMFLGFFGIIAGIFYLITAMKPIQTMYAKVVEKNGLSVIFEFKDGSRKTLTTLNNIGLVAGDVGIVSFKGNIVVEFKKKNNV